jgi:hypothetical protein
MSNKLAPIPIPFDLKTLTTVRTYREFPTKYIQDLIVADCWSIFITNDTRSKIERVLYNSRPLTLNGIKLDGLPIGADDMRMQLGRDASWLAAYVHRCKTVGIVMGCSAFKEYYFSASSTSCRGGSNLFEWTYIEVEVDHSIAWNRSGLGDNSWEQSTRARLGIE